MTVLAATFVAEYPEFAALHSEDAPLIVAVLARAERRICSDWEPEDRRDDVVMLQTAKMLALGPWGRNAKLSEPGKPTAYCEELKEIKRAHAFARSRAV